MAIKYLSINNESINFNNIPKLNTQNTFLNNQVFLITSPSDEISIKSNNLDINNPNDPNTWWNTNPDGTQWNENGIGILDKNNNVIAHFKGGMWKNNQQTYCFVRVYDNSKSTFSEIQLIYKDGYFYHYGYTPIQSASDNQIATCDWVRNLLIRNGINLTS